MSIARHHAEWLSLLEITGPFLSMPVLIEAFRQGLEAQIPIPRAIYTRFMRNGPTTWPDSVLNQPCTPVVAKNST